VTVVAGSRRGLTVFAAALVVLVIGVLGAIINIAFSGGLGSVFVVFFAIGCVAAVSQVHTDDLFGAVVTPPLVYGVITVAVGVLHPSSGDAAKTTRDQIVNVGLELVLSAPALIIGFLLVVVIGVIRGQRAKVARRARERALAASGENRPRPPR
jgi:ABC-type antimicrobial peptide transport system permease subunit